MQNKLNPLLLIYKEKNNNEYRSTRYPTPETTTLNIRKLVASIKVAEATIRRNEIEEEIKTSIASDDGDMTLLKNQVNHLDDEIALWNPHI